MSQTGNYSILREKNLKGEIMKKIIFLTTLVVGLSFSTAAWAAEKIDNFHAIIQINSDSSITVTEQIDYNFGAAQKHGIYRDIPIKYKARGGNYKLRISDIWVADENGVAYNFTTSYPGNNIQIKIGDADKYVTDKKTYVINYKIKRAINYFEAHDELYWNVTGDKWPVTINQASAQVNLPKEIPASELQKDCFAGAFAETIRCDSQINLGSNNLISGVLFENSTLYSGEGLTIAVGFPKGLVVQPSRGEIFLETLKDNWVLFLPLFVLVILLYLWSTRGRDPEGRKTIVAQFDPPDNLTAAEVGTIIDEKAHKKDISAQIINLAVKGYLKIIRKEKKDYLLEKLRAEDDLVNGFEKKLMESLFEKKQRVKLSDLKNKFYKDLEMVKNQVYQATVAKGYFRKNPKKVRSTYAVIGILILFFGFFSGTFGGGLAVFSFFVSGIIIIIFSFFMPARTKKGVLAKEHILGLKEYLTVAEKDRIKFHNAPEKNPKLFEKLLPFAMVLGVEKEWARQFEGIYNQQPSWYQDSTGGYLSAIYLASSLNSFQSSANTTLASRPSSAASGGSGFSGGSGGGFGGGGGGSW